MHNITRLQNKLNTARSQFNNMPIADFNAAREKIALDEAKAIIEEIQFSKVTVPGTGLFAASVAISGNSVIGNLS